MRINSHALDAYTQGAVDRTSEVKSDQPAAARGTSKSESTNAASLSISGEARRLAAASPAIDTERVQAIRDRIEAGEFEIDSTHIAKRILNRLA